MVMLDFYKYNLKNNKFYFNLYLYFIILNYKLLIFFPYEISSIRLKFLKYSPSYINSLLFNDEKFTNIFKKNMVIVYNNNLSLFNVIDDQVLHLIIMLAIDFYFVNIKYILYIKFLFSMLNKNFFFYSITFYRFIYIFLRYIYVVKN